MASEGDINATNAANVKQDVGKKHCKGRKNLKKNEEIPIEPTPSEALLTLCH